MVAVGFNPRKGDPKKTAVAERRLIGIGVIRSLAISCVAPRRGSFAGVPPVG